MSDKNDLDSKKGWKIFDAIFSAGFFQFLFESEKARKENDDRRFKQLLYGLVFGVLCSVILFIIVWWNW
jgi:hypothetical protein